MNRRLKQQTDSMGMLLDTVCNFFGGIVLIALLVALTASNETSNNPDSDVNATRVEEKINQLKRASIPHEEALEHVSGPHCGNLLQFLPENFLTLDMGNLKHLPSFVDKKTSSSFSAVVMETMFGWLSVASSLGSRSNSLKFRFCLWGTLIATSLSIQVSLAR